MEVEKNWSELFMVMTESESGRVQATDEKALSAMWVEEFFTKLLVFKERLDKRAAAAAKANGKTNSRY
jgi:hypothetical protein